MADELSAARSALSFLGELQPDLRGAAVFGPDGRMVASTEAGEAWRQAGSQLLGRLDRAADGVCAEAHLATLSGEIFMVTNDGYRLLAVAERFVLASLLTFDMRTALREMNKEVPNAS